MAILVKAESLTQPHKFGVYLIERITTLNNLGCFYRRINEIDSAIRIF